MAWHINERLHRIHRSSIAQYHDYDISIYHTWKFSS